MRASRTRQVWVSPAVWLAGLAIAPQERADWRAGWVTELSVRGLQGLRSLVRDIAWHRERHPHRPLHAFLAIPFVPELLALAVVACAGMSWGLYSKPVLPYPELDRLVRFQRGGQYLGAVQSVVTATLVERARELREFEEIATYHLIYGWPAGLRISANLLPMIGAGVLHGTLPATSHEALLTYECWRSRFRGDQSLFGRNVPLGNAYYRITGVLDPGFFFVSHAVCFVAGLPPLPRASGTVVRLRAGVTLDHAQKALRSLSNEIEPHWGRDAFRVSPLLRDRRPEHLWFTVGLFVTAGVIAVGVLAFKRRKGKLLYASLLLRLAISISVLGLAGYSLDEWVRLRFLSVALFHQWFYLLLVAVVVLFTVWDHLRRCQQCLSRVGMPVSFGSWSSMVVDRPATEFVCPKGHGLLFVHEIGQKHDRWTALDASWRSLFTNRFGK